MLLIKLLSSYFIKYCVMTINRSYLGQEPQSLVLNLMYKYLYKPKYM